MATYTITAPTNIDSLASKTGGDIFNVNGGTLTIDQDSRYGTNATTSATLGAITLSATLGGTVEVDARKVRIIPFDTGTGNVPAYNTDITQGGATGKMIGVYSALNVAPTTPGAAMPVSGFIKIKQWNDVAYTAVALGGIGATATGADRVGWIEIVGDEAGLCTVNRLNSFRVRGDWFELGTTDGTRATTYQIPSNGTLQYHGGVWVETGSGTGVYKFYPCAGTRPATDANLATDEVRGGWCWISTAGLLRLGHDGTNSTGGYIPPSGRRIRMPNVFMANATVAARTANVLPNVTLTTRYEFATTGGGVLDINFASCSWWLNVNQPYRFDITNTAVCTTLTATEVASPLTWTNVGVGMEAALSATVLVLSQCFAGGAITDCVFARAAMTANGQATGVISDVSGFTFTNTAWRCVARATFTTPSSLLVTRMASSTLIGTILGSGRLSATTCTDLTVTDSVYFDTPVGNTSAVGPSSAFDLLSSCTNVKFDGLTFGGLNLVQPFNGILNVGAAGCARIKLRNIGTYASPLSLGSPRVDDAAWTRVTTVATVTQANHGFVVNDTIWVVVVSDAAGIAVGAKTIATVPTANTFTFAAVNAGAASGTLCYFGTKAANVFTLAAGAAANDVEVKRVYAPHTRTNLYTADNSSKNVVLENVLSDYLNAPLIAMLNGFFRNVSGTPPLTAQQAVYGTHWLNGYVVDVADTTDAQAWTRSAAVVTVTSAGHSLRTGMLIGVTVSSSLAAVPKRTYTVTAISSTQFQITGLSAGAASGTLTYQVANGRIGVQMNEKTAETDSAYVVDSGAPAFTSSGGLVMPTVGDKITFTTLEYIIGQGNAFPTFDVVLAGGGSVNNFAFTYQIDKNDGAGYGAVRTLRRRIATGATWANSGTTITVPDSSIFAIGDRFIQGTNVGVEWNARVTSIDNATTISVDTAHTAAGTNTSLIWSYLPEESSLGPETGIKFKWSIETTTAIATAITSLYIQAQSTVAGRAFQYPLDPVAATLSLTGLQPGTEVHVYRVSDDVEIAGTEATVGSTFTYNYQHSGVDVATYITVIKVGFQWIRYNNQILTTDGLTLPVFQATDRNYKNP